MLLVCDGWNRINNQPDVADSNIITLGICAGVGMLEEAVRLVFPGSRCAAYIEWEAYAAATLLARMEDASLEPTPVWCGDLRDFNATPFCGLVDILTAGLPCQPYSCAGRRQGNTDERSWSQNGDGPIPGFLRIVSECRPALVFLENVPTWVRNGWFRSVGDELCRMGYEIVEPVFIAASDVGASHQRERVFILAHAARVRRFGTRGRPAADQREGLCVPGNGCAEMEHAASERGTTAELSGFGPGIEPADSPIFAPHPGDREWRRILAESTHLAPAIEPGFRCVVDGLALVVDEARADQLRCVGNGVVALQAAVAFVELLRRAKPLRTGAFHWWKF